MTSSTDRRLRVASVPVGVAALACVLAVWTPLFRNPAVGDTVTLLEVHGLSGRAFASGVVILTLVVVSGAAGLMSLRRPGQRLDLVAFGCACAAVLAVVLFGFTSVLRRAPGTSCFAFYGDDGGCESRPIDHPPSWGFAVLALVAVALVAVFAPAGVRRRTRVLPPRTAHAVVVVGALAVVGSLALPVYREVHGDDVVVSGLAGWHSPFAVLAAVSASVAALALLRARLRKLTVLAALACSALALAAGVALPSATSTSPYFAHHDLGAIVITVPVWLDRPYLVLVAGAVLVLAGAGSASRPTTGCDRAGGTMGRCVTGPVRLRGR